MYFFQVLTESEISMEGKLRVMKILEEQKKILRLCMSKPQVSSLKGFNLEHAHLDSHETPVLNNSIFPNHRLIVMRFKIALENTIVVLRFDCFT